MKILGIKTAYRLTKQKVLNTVCVIVVSALCAASAVAVNIVLNNTDVQALRVDSGDMVDVYDVIPAEIAPDRDTYNIKNPVASTGDNAEKLGQTDPTITETEEPEETEETTAEETEETSSETEEVDISDSTDISVIMQELKRLNPDVDIEFDAVERICYTSVSPKKLVLPKGFYYNEKNGITNKHNTKTGVYISIDVRKMDKKKDDSEAKKGKIGELIEKAKKNTFVRITALALARASASFDKPLSSLACFASCTACSTASKASITSL